MKAALKENYTITNKWEDRQYIGITLDWDYMQRQVHLSIPTYVAKAPRHFKHELKEKKIHLTARHQSNMEQRNSTYATQALTASLLDKEGKHFIQQVCEYFCS